MKDYTFLNKEALDYMLFSANKPDLSKVWVWGWDKRWSHDTWTQLHVDHVIYIQLDKAVSNNCLFIISETAPKWIPDFHVKELAKGIYAHEYPANNSISIFELSESSCKWRQVGYSYMNENSVYIISRDEPVYHPTQHVIAKKMLSDLKEYNNKHAPNMNKKISEPTTILTSIVSAAQSDLDSIRSTYDSDPSLKAYFWLAYKREWEYTNRPSWDPQYKWGIDKESPVLPPKDRYKITVNGVDYNYDLYSDLSASRIAIEIEAFAKSKTTYTWEKIK